MKTEMNVALERPARKAGGDRYMEPKSGFTIYIPQTISRPKGTPLEVIHLTFEGKDE